MDIGDPDSEARHSYTIESAPAPAGHPATDDDTAAAGGLRDADSATGAGRFEVGWLGPVVGPEACASGKDGSGPVSTECDGGRLFMLGAGGGSSGGHGAEATRRAAAGPVRISFTLRGLQRSGGGGGGGPVLLRRLMDFSFPDQVCPIPGRRIRVRAHAHPSARSAVWRCGPAAMALRASSFDEQQSLSHAAHTHPSLHARASEPMSYGYVCVASKTTTTKIGC